MEVTAIKLFIFAVCSRIRRLQSLNHYTKRIRHQIPDLRRLICQGNHGAYGLGLPERCLQVFRGHLMGHRVQERPSLSGGSPTVGPIVGDNEPRGLSSCGGPYECSSFVGARSDCRSQNFIRECFCNSS